MSLAGDRTFVGFGFGAIQAGLFLYEAQRSGNFGRLVVAEVLPDVVADVRRAGGYFALNIAHDDRIERTTVGPVEIYDPAAAGDREALIEAIADAGEIATAIPSVQFYITDGPGSLHRLLAAGLRRKRERAGPRAVIYAAENHNNAAAILERAVGAEIEVEHQKMIRARACFLNTVIGKMSGVKRDAAEIESQGLRPTTPGSARAFLVEAFNRILISTIAFDPDPSAAPYRRGITVFEEKADLLPFEEAKLYGHNAVHALAAYLGALRGVEFIAELRQMPEMMAFLGGAFIEESGAALIKKHAGVDPLFTPAGFTAYTDDLLTRMTNPFLRDSVERVGRDPARKLGWQDRLVGTMRLALAQGIEPPRFGLGAAAALTAWDIPGLQTEAGIRQRLGELWAQDNPDQKEQEPVLDEILRGRRRLQAWIKIGVL